MFRVITFDEFGLNVKNDFYSIRKEIFYDRLGWDVEVHDSQEFDAFDGLNTVYLLGMLGDRVFAGVRFCCFSAPNMLNGPFSQYFLTRIRHSVDVIEASRFFVDKNFVKREFSSDMSITRMLFLSMFSFCNDREIKKIIAVVSKAMLRIVRRHGWQYEVLEESATEAQDKIYLIAMMITELSYARLSERVEIRKVNPVDGLTMSMNKRQS